MRVLHVINGLGPGGAERSLAEMLPGFAGAGLDPTVAVFRRRHEGVEDQVQEAGIPVRFLPDGGWLRRIREVRRLIVELDADVVHTTVFEADVASRLAAVGTGTPVVTSVVNPSYGAARTGDPNVRAWKLAAARRVDAVTARRLGAGFHAITEAVRNGAVLDLGVEAGAIAVVPRGRSQERLGQPSDQRRRAVRARFDVPPDSFLVLNVGRRDYQKGQDTLLEALALLRDRSPRPFQAIIAGRDGSESARLAEAMARLGLEHHVRFVGHVDDVPDLLAAADVFVFPSRFEGLGGAILEAFALGVPVVASDVPAIREVLRDGELGILAPPGDAAAFAAAIEQVAEAPDGARRRADKARLVFEEQYGLDRVTRDMATWLRGFAGGVRR